jgi:hypothetical protein
MLCEEWTGDIIKLLKFIFKENEYKYELKVVLVDYAAWNVEILMQDADFQQLLDWVPSLEKAIFRAMRTEDMTRDHFSFVSYGWRAARNLFCSFLERDRKYTHVLI